MLLHRRQKSGQGYVNRVHSHRKGRNGKVAQVVGEKPQRYACCDFFGRDQNGGTHLRCAGAIHYHSGNCAPIGGGCQRRRPCTHQPSETQHADRSESQTVHLPCGVTAAAGAAFTVKSAVGVIVCLVRLSVTSTSR